MSKSISKAYEILRSYNGTNNQIRYYKSQYEKGKLILEDFGVEYILRNHDYEPFEVNKTVRISSDFGMAMHDKYELDFVPEKIRISRVIGEMGKSYHCYVKYRQSVDYQLMYVQKRCILDKLVDIDWKNTEVDFDRFDKMTENLGRKLKEHQKEGVKFLLTNKKCILADDMGCGKMQDVDTMIPTPDGIRRFGDLIPGDSVFGCDGKSHTVTATFNHKNKDIYEIEFTDGTKTNSGLEHLWIVQDTNNIRRGQGWQVMSLGDILDRGLKWKNKNNRYKFRIPICEPVDYPEREYFIHPYILGLAIGDGNLCNKVFSISIPKHENETIERVNNLLNENYKLSANLYGVCPNYLIIKKESVKNTPNLYIREIKKLGLNVHGNFKFIPGEYKIGSIEQRKELLMGLMDSDGYISKERNRMHYSTNSKQLAEDVCDLVRSLGGLAHIYSRIRKKTGRVEYTVVIQIKFCPFKLERKRKRFTIDDTHKKYLVKSIKSVNLLKTCDAMCITVDSPDKSYLTNDYIVTHNTVTATISALAGEYKKILVITTASLKTTWKKDVLLYEDASNIEIVSGSDWKVGNRFTITNYDIIQNFYKVPEEPVFEIEEIRDHEGNIVETLRVPVMVKSKSTGKMVQKMQKSRKKADILKALDESPLFQAGFDCVIIDEAQKLSNNTSIRYKTISDMLRRMAPKAVYLLTGTPLTNRPINLYHILKLIDADVTDDYRYYVRRYCGGREMHLRDGRTIMKMGDATNLDELREKIKDVYIRRLASETGEMVEKRISRRYYDLNGSQRAEYDRLWNEYQEAQADAGMDDTEEYRQLVEGMLVRQYLAKEMTANTISLVDDFIEDGEKVVIITTFQDEMDILKEYYGDRCVVYNGKMTAKQKDKAQDAFNNDKKIKVFIGQIIACGVGLNLQASRIVVFNSYSWVAADNRQSESRVHRLTQTRDVECIYQLFTDSVSQDMFEKVLFKEYLMDEVIKSENNKKKKD